MALEALDTGWIRSVWDLFLGYSCVSRWLGCCFGVMQRFGRLVVFREPRFIYDTELDIANNYTIGFASLISLFLDFFFTVHLITDLIDLQCDTCVID